MIELRVNKWNIWMNKMGMVSLGFSVVKNDEIVEKVWECG